METDARRCQPETKGDRIVEALLAGPQDPGHPFLAGGLTYGQLYAQAETVGWQMKDLPNTSSPLCLCAEDKGFVAAAFLAALKQGIPLMIPYALDINTLNEARERLPYTHALVDKARPLPAGVTGVRMPRDQRSAMGAASGTPLAWEAPWLYLFTGGSTGTPRIWSKTPCNLLREADYLARTFRISHDDTIVATVPPNHIYGLLYAILLPLVSGAAVEASMPSFPHEIADRLETAQATVLVSIPAHYRTLKQTAIGQHQVRLAFSSAGALPEPDAGRFHETTGIAITEIYGSTETGGIAQRTRTKGQTALHPFGCVDIRIENQHLEVKSAFLSNELPRSTGGFFETADRAQWNDPGGFTLLGRSDGIVKVGGKRVDLAVTKEALLSVDGVRDVYVFAQPIRSGRENEILALVEGSATADQLIDAAKRKLPPYARPRGIKVTAKIPLTSTGKYRRTAIKVYFKPDP